MASGAGVPSKPVEKTHLFRVQQDGLDTLSVGATGQTLHNVKPAIAVDALEAFLCQELLNHL